jgi:internalin A
MDDLALEIRRAKRGNTTRMDLSGRGLSKFPNDLYSLVSLEELDLSGNNISTVESDISKLLNLRSLNLSGNAIASLPEDI